VKLLSILHHKGEDNIKMALTGAASQGMDGINVLRESLKTWLLRY
jgi:hypothetical protein